MNGIRHNGEMDMKVRPESALQRERGSVLGESNISRFSISPFGLLVVSSWKVSVVLFSGLSSTKIAIRSLAFWLNRRISFAFKRFIFGIPESRSLAKIAILVVYVFS